MNTALPTAAVVDACLRLNVPRRIAPADVKPLWPGMSVMGRALPVKHYGSVDVFFDAMSRASRGDILVIDNGGRDDEGCAGDLTAIEAMHYGITAFVIWGRHRDSAVIRQLGLPLFSRGSWPSGPERLDRVDAAPARIGNVVVAEGDVVVADDDGVVFVANDEWQRVREAAASIMKREQAQADLVRTGTSMHDQFKWDEYVTKRREDPAYDLRTHLRAIGGAIEV